MFYAYCDDAKPKLDTWAILSKAARRAGEGILESILDF